LSRGNLGDQAGGTDPDRAVQSGVGFHALVQGMRGFERGTVQAFGAGHVEVGFVDGSHFDLRGKRAQDFVDFLGTLTVAFGMSVDEDRLRTHLGCSAEGHGGINAEFSRCVGGGGDYAALVTLSADYDCLAF
jgi:hypothetical protein